MAGDLPTGTVTFLFTDIEGSTRLWEDRPDEMRAALARHDEIVRASIEGHGGHVFATGGDGFAVAFAAAADAVAAGVEAQRGLVAESSSLSLDVRIGVHTGEAAERGGDYFGSVVNRAARLMSVAHGGQVLVSEVTERILGDQTMLRPLGEHRLRDLGEALGVFQVIADGLPHEFPPLRSLDAYEGNLPRQLSSFVGRTEELAQLTDHVRSSRLVTLIGVGGTGKTRLALQAAAEMAPDFDDGAWLVELGLAGDAGAVSERFMTSLGIRATQGVSLEDRIIEYLTGRDLLLIVDNCEHVLSAVVPMIESVLHNAPEVTIVATSREPLLAQGEQLMAVPSLSYEEGEGRGEAVSLFLERVRAERPALSFDSEFVDAAVDICRRLDGMPLAIELAASRCRTMDIADVRRRLDERFRLLTGGRRTTVERHQTLQATVDWSYDLLSAVERRVFDRLSVFAGWFGIADAAGVCTDEELDELDVVDALSLLVDKSMCMLASDRHRGSYRLLETLRAYGRANLHAAGSLEGLRRNHAVHYRDRMQHAATTLMGPDEVDVADGLTDSAPDLRAALEWAANAGEHSLCADFLPCAQRLMWRGWLEVYDWFADIEPLLPRTPEFLGILAGDAFVLRGDHERTRRLAGEAIAIEAPPGNLWLAYNFRAFSYMNFGDFEQAIDDHQRGYEDSRQSKDDCVRLMGGFGLSVLQSALDRPDNGVAQAIYDRSVELGWGTGRAVGLWLLARQQTKPDPNTAMITYQAAVDLANEIGNTYVDGWARRELWRLQITRDSTQAAAAGAIDVLEHFFEQGNNIDTAVTLAQVILLFDKVHTHEPVVVLLGHLDAVHPQDIDDKDRLDSAVDRTRLAIGARWNELEERGASMSRKEALDYTITWLRTLT